MTSPRRASAGVERLSWLLLLLGILASVWLVRRSRHAPSIERRELDVTLAVPAGPALLVTLDASALPPSALRELLSGGGDARLGLRELCGFEPLLAVRRLAFSMPSAGAGDADFALIASTTLEPEAVLGCAEAVIRKRGGTPARARLAEFESVRDRAKPRGEIAIRGDGLLALSGGNYFRAVVDAASGSDAPDQAARLRQAVHAKLRSKLAGAQLLLSVVGDAVLPLPGVQALGAGLSIGADVRLRGAIYCGSAVACHEARAALASIGEDLPPLRELRFVEHGQELDVSGRLALAELGRAWSRWLEP